eukprot:1908731-Prymnesium_polylepis.1
MAHTCAYGSKLVHMARKHFRNGQQRTKHVAESCLGCIHVWAGYLVDHHDGVDGVDWRGRRFVGTTLHRQQTGSSSYEGEEKL